MAQHVDGGLFDRCVRNGERVLTELAIHSPGKVEVLEAEVDNGIVLFEQVSLTHGLVSENKLVGAFKTSQTHLALDMVHSGVEPEQGIGGIQQHTIIAGYTQLLHYLKRGLQGHVGGRDTSGTNTIMKGLKYHLGINILHAQIGVRHILPAESAGITQLEPLLVHGARHDSRGAFHSVESATIV